MSTDALRDEHESLQRAVKASRRAFERTPESAFVKAGADVIADYLDARKADVSREDAVKGIEAVLRAIWPHKPSKFSATCDLCEDTGWQEHVCSDSSGRCSRENCVRNPEREHAYVSPCGCMKGDRFRPSPYAPEDEIAAVGRTRKPKARGFQRFGS